jgi:hypothetical protein
MFSLEDIGLKDMDSSSTHTDNTLTCTDDLTHLTNAHK